MSDFCKKLGISTKTIKVIFGAVINLFNENKNVIFDLERNRLSKKFSEFIVDHHGKKPTYKQLQKFYSRTATILNSCFDGKYTVFEEWHSGKPVEE